VPSAHFDHTAPVQHPADPGVWLGSQNALGKLTDSVTAVVSLCRVGTAEVPEGLESIQVRLIDQPGHNPNLDFTLADATDVLAELRTEGKEVFVHCAEAHSRTAAVGALYAMRHRGVPAGQAWAQVESVLPHFAPSADAGRGRPARSRWMIIRSFDSPARPRSRNRPNMMCYGMSGNLVAEYYNTGMLLNHQLLLQERPGYVMKCRAFRRIRLPKVAPVLARPREPDRTYVECARARGI
jgi:hypothetical protein